MKLFPDSEGKMNYDEITSDSTAQDLLDAIDIYLSDHNLSCDKCRESCCKKSWAVEVDNVFVNKFCNWEEETISKFVQDKLLKTKNHFKEFDQYIFKKERNCCYVTENNLCTVYEQRPLICRLYVCNAKSHRYNVIRELTGATYLKALVLEEKMRKNNYQPRTVKKYGRNPAVFAKDYNILLVDIFRYALDEGWLDPDDVPELQQVIRLTGR
jgi:Fe-S-cluster containining protein